MVTTFSPAEIDRVREAVDLVEVARQHVALKQAGRRYKGLCPFHEERTPSFTVDPVQNLFYCFGCGAGGNIFQFVERAEGLSFPDAVARVAELAGIESAAEQRSEDASEREARRKRGRLFEIHREAATLFTGWLWEARGEPARRYLKRRGVTGEAARAFGLGFALPEWDALNRTLAERGFSEEEIVEAGLAAPRKSGSGVYDRFRGRIIFPVRGLDGRTVAFGGRILAGQEGPKYLNSPETPIYHKGKLLYGVYEARKTLQRQGEAILVEGYTDALALHRVGLTEAVASCGTALTSEHASLLKRLVRRVVLAYDADTAGEAASLRGLETLARAGLEVRVLSLPEGEDPDGLVRRVGGDAFRRALVRALPLNEYKLRAAVRGIDLRTTEGKLSGAAKVVPILARMERAVERAEYTAWSARLLQISVDDLEQDVRAYEENAGREGSSRHRIRRVAYTNRDFGRARPSSGPSGAKAAGDGGSRPTPERMERELLRILVRQPEKLAEVVPVLAPDELSSKSLEGLFDSLRTAWSGGEINRREDLIKLPDPALRELADELSREEKAIAGQTHSLDVVARCVKEASLVRRLRRLEGELIAVDVKGNQASDRAEMSALTRLGALVIAYGELRRECRTWLGPQEAFGRWTGLEVS